MQKFKVHIEGRQNIRFVWSKVAKSFVVTPHEEEDTILYLEDLASTELITKAEGRTMLVTALPIEETKVKFDRETLQKAYNKVDYYTKRIEEALECKNNSMFKRNKYKDVALTMELLKYQERKEATINAYVDIGIDERILIEGLPKEH